MHLSSNPGCRPGHLPVLLPRRRATPAAVNTHAAIFTHLIHLLLRHQAAGLDIYQTYYLDAEHHRQLWTDGEVAQDKVLASRWMRQFAHTWTHFAYWVPWVSAAQRWRGRIVRPGCPGVPPLRSITVTVTVTVTVAVTDRTAVPTKLDNVPCCQRTVVLCCLLS